MIKILVLLFCSWVFFIPAGFATPPVSINLSYDAAKGVLHIEAVHPSFDLNKSYVRLVVVSVNDTQVSSVDYFRQTDYNEFTDDVPLAVQAGDVIKVDLFCSLGGEMAKELTVPKSDAQDPGQSTDTVTANSSIENAND